MEFVGYLKAWEVNINTIRCHGEKHEVPTVSCEKHGLHGDVLAGV